MHTFRIPAALADRLAALGRAESATLFMTLLAAFHALLSRLTGEPDIVVGSPVANRTRRDVEDIIGFFVNDLALRLDMSSDPTFRELLASAREAVLGGLGEIGLNSLVLETADTLVVVDAGLMFPEDHMLGIDIVIPDYSYLYTRRDKNAALILTHGHEDHIGAVPFLLKELPLPIYGTPLTLALLKEKLKEHGLLEQADLREIRPRETLSFGPFTFDFIGVSHSIVDGVGFAVTTPQGIVIASNQQVDLSAVGNRRRPGGGSFAARHLANGHTHRAVLYPGSDLLILIIAIEISGSDIMGLVIRANVHVAGGNPGERGWLFAELPATQHLIAAAQVVGVYQ